MVAAAMSANPNLRRVLQHVLHGWPSSKPEVASELRTFFDVYAPQINAEVRRFNRVMKDGLRTGLADGHEFITAVRHTLAAHRTTSQGTTGVTPAAPMLWFPVLTTVVSGATEDQLSCDRARPVPTTADVGAA